jgi:hypothetical protein
MGRERIGTRKFHIKNLSFCFPFHKSCTLTQISRTFADKQAQFLLFAYQVKKVPIRSNVESWNFKN